jgi:hypothetical protein
MADSTDLNLTHAVSPIRRAQTPNSIAPARRQRRC